MGDDPAAAIRTFAGATGIDTRFVTEEGLEPVGGPDFDPTHSEQEAVMRSGIMTSPGQTGRAYAPVLPAEIVLGREAGGLAIYRHKDTGEEIRINPNDFTKEWNADHLQALKAGKLERVGFEKVEKPGEAYTDVDEKVVLAAVRVQHRLNQLNARIARLKGTDDAGEGIIAQEQARLKELQGSEDFVRDDEDSVVQPGQRGAIAHWGLAHGASGGVYGAHHDEPPALHEAAPGTIRDIQDLQRELVNLKDLRVRLAQIHAVTLGGYDPTQAQMEKYVGAFKDEPLPGTVGASKQAKAKLRAARERGQE